jgi:hypothetical protein
MAFVDSRDGSFVYSSDRQTATTFPNGPTMDGCLGFDFHISAAGKVRRKKWLRSHPIRPLQTKE